MCSSTTVEKLEISTESILGIYEYVQTICFYLCVTEELTGDFRKSLTVNGN